MIPLACVVRRLISVETFGGGGGLGVALWLQKPIQSCFCDTFE